MPKFLRPKNLWRVVRRESRVRSVPRQNVRASSCWWAKKCGGCFDRKSHAVHAAENVRASSCWRSPTNCRHRGPSGGRSPTPPAHESVGINVLLKARRPPEELPAGHVVYADLLLSLHASTPLDRGALQQLHRLRSAVGKGSRGPVRRPGHRHRGDASGLGLVSHRRLAGRRRRRQRRCVGLVHGALLSRMRYLKKTWSRMGAASAQPRLPRWSSFAAQSFSWFPPASFRRFSLRCSPARASP